MEDEGSEILSGAERGITACEIELGHMFLIGRTPEGRPFTHDPQRAALYLGRAHAKGATTATYLLATMYESGTGVLLDSATALSMYTLAADRGSFMACVRLGRFFATRSSAVDAMEKAHSWYQRALSCEDVDLCPEKIEAQRFITDHPT